MKVCVQRISIERSVIGATVVEIPYRRCSPAWTTPENSRLNKNLSHHRDSNPDPLIWNPALNIDIKICNFATILFYKYLGLHIEIFTFPPYGFGN